MVSGSWADLQVAADRRPEAVRPHRLVGGAPWCADRGRRRAGPTKADHEGAGENPSGTQTSFSANMVASEGTGTGGGFA